MIRPNSLPSTHSLAGRDGELVLVSITVRPRLLEQLLETLAETSYFINPQIFPNSRHGARVEFPAYESWLAPLGEAIRKNGLEPVEFEATQMLTKLAS